MITAAIVIAMLWTMGAPFWLQVTGTVLLSVGIVCRLIKLGGGLR